MKKLLAPLLATFILSACGGGGGNSSVPAAAKTATQSKVTGSVVISIPLGTTTTQSSARPARFPQFVSPNASSVELSINGGSDTNFDVSSTSSLCTTVPSSGARNCTLTFGAPAGSDTFAFLIFSGPNGTGQQLASATNVQTIAAGTAFNFTVAMNAAVGVIVVEFFPSSGGGTCPDSPNGYNGLIEGCTGSGPVTVTVNDPSGATVTGSAPYATPLQLTTTDPAVTVSPTTVTAPNQTVTIGYAGAAFQTGTTMVSLNVTAGGQTGSLTLPVRESNLYVANSNAPPGNSDNGGGNVTVYRFGATTPLRTLTGGLENPVQPMLDSNGKLWVLDNSSSSNPYINVYAPGATGSATPISQIANIGMVDSDLNCEAMAFNPSESQLFVTCDDDQIHVFPTNFFGTAPAMSLQTVSLNDDDWNGPPVGLTFDNSGNLYVAQPNSPNAMYQYLVSSLPTSGTDQSIFSAHSMAGGSASWPGNVEPIALLVDNAGTLYASIAYFNSAPGGPDSNNQIAFWNTTSIPCNNCAPTASIGGMPFTMHAPAGIVLDPVGNLYVSNNFQNTVTEISRATLVAANGSIVNPPVLRTINTGPSPDAPTGMTVGP